MSNEVQKPSANLTDAHVQWRNRPGDQRFETLEQLRASVHSRRIRSRSTDVDLPRLAVDDESGQLVLNSEVSPCIPSHWAFGQLATAVGAPSSYLRTLPLPVLVPCLNHGLKANPERNTLKFMTIAPEAGNDELATLQAVTSPTYGRIWDADCVDAVARIRERSGGKFHNPLAYVGGEQRPSGLYASDHDVFMFMIDRGSLLEAGPRAKLNRGFIVWNSETGAKTFGLMTFLFNVVCGNHIIWGAQDVNKLVIRHTSGGPGRFDSQAEPALRAYCEASEKPVLDTIRKAQDYLLPTPDKLGDFAGKFGKFTKSELTEGVRFAKSEEGECRTLWQLVQGLTAYARGFEYVDTRLDLEKRAGGLLNSVSAD